MRTAKLNIGLDRNDTGRNEPGTVIAAIRLSGLTILDGLRVEQSATESTVIVNVAGPDHNAIIGAVFLMCGTLAQDCIATRINCDIGQPVGLIVGPNAVKWGEFNPAYFLE
jgi:hypothetical protein